jgi:hypothetical protein
MPNFPGNPPPPRPRLVYFSSQPTPQCPFPANPRPDSYLSFTIGILQISKNKFRKKNVPLFKKSGVSLL